MKKIVLLLLLCMPLILIMGVSIFGKIINTAYSIPVESVQFIDNSNEPIDDSNYEVVLENGDTHQLLYRILPALATDKKVSFESSNNNICTVSDKGLVTAVATGKVEITIKTYDNDRKAKMNIGVVVSKIQSISLFLPQTMNIHQVINLNNSGIIIFVPARGIDNRVVFESSDSDVIRIENNVLKAVAPGVAVITATSVADPSITDSVTITVSDTDAVLWLLDSEVITHSSTIELSLYVGVNTVVCGDNKPEFELSNSMGKVTLNGSIATFEAPGIASFKVRITDLNNVVHTLEVKLLVTYVI